ncbi:hypothetical protein NDN11_03605 [Acinetobacter sp. C26M]|uniref:hypothetical protein n=1 Tax=unclassified Acinetobacter TaxID=196816 RepID=UPI0020375C49|nr:MULTISPECIES: hypothetical protein [unclassified Acinetobacter]USA47221.1 hypothetical protein NDN11_03605 [Acinetobacter sp. C26M]USA50702.1 hypothetical protein NDN12_03605 [Acinetobacter sp. C26G]
MVKIIFNTPGQADDLSPLLLEKWNEEIKKQYESHVKMEIASGVTLGSRFFAFDPTTIPNSITVNSVKWFGDPAEPAFCQNSDVAQKLSDWGIKGRHHFHNEYCEYTVEYKIDSTGKQRPKRVQITTELREYWVTIAKHDPNFLKQLASTVLGIPVTWEDLYGNDPTNMTIEERELSFSTQVAGNGDGNNPSQPVGKLNTENALFMTHPINGLDDLIYIVMFGAKPYARKNGSQFEKVTKYAIFKEYNVEHLACRHADPAAAMGAYGAVFEGRKIAFNQNLGMYILSFAKNNFLYNGNSIPDSWVRFSRGKNNLHQRLVFGPSDEENVFLDDITVEKGGNDVPIKGGFEVLQHIEVGPIIQISQPSEVNSSDYQLITESDDSLQCDKAKICSNIATFWTEYNRGSLIRIAPRTTKIGS